LRAILDEISVPLDVLTEARRRRDDVLAIACEHAISRARYVSGSVAYGTANSPIEDADGGIKGDRRLDPMREFGPDAPGGGRPPDELMQYFGEYIVVRLRRRGYARATFDASGKRSVKFELHEPVTIEKFGVVDPFVDFIVGLARREGRGLWIPNKNCPAGWDIADPEYHLQVMNHQGAQELRTLRAHVVRLAKRAVKRDRDLGRTPVICSWNICALALALFDDASLPLHVALAEFFEFASTEIASGLTPDPSPVVAPIELPAGVDNAMASARLAEMARHAYDAATAPDEAAARRAYSRLYGPELDAIRERERSAADRRLRLGLPAAAIAPSRFHKATRSDGA
jgi:hypothetical protein